MPTQSTVLHDQLLTTVELGVDGMRKSWRIPNHSLYNDLVSVINYQTNRFVILIKYARVPYTPSSTVEHNNSYDILSYSSTPE